MTQPIKPCLLCTRVQDPDACENKQCAQWRSWFLAKWNHTKQLFGCSPAYINPCQDCQQAEIFCTEHCPARIRYEQEVTL